MIDRNTVGDRGEAMFYLAISRLHGERPLFRPVYLGGKWPTADLIVELEDEPGMFFLVQVKTSTRGYTKDLKRLFISAERARLQALADAPLPTYLVGVDERGEQVYLNAVQGTIAAGRSSISVEHSAKDASVRERLYREVKAFWRGVRESKLWTTSEFTDTRRELETDERV